MIEQLVARVFNVRNVAHLEHWSTESASIHKYTGETYNDLIALLDPFVETYQAAYDMLGKIPEKDKTWENKSTEKALTELALWINENRETLCKDLSALENLLDALSSRVLQLIFVLKRLR